MRRRFSFDLRCLTMDTAEGRITDGFLNQARLRFVPLEMLEMETYSNDSFTSLIEKFGDSGTNDGKLSSGLRPSVNV